MDYIDKIHNFNKFIFKGKKKLGILGKSPCIYTVVSQKNTIAYYGDFTFFFLGE